VIITAMLVAKRIGNATGREHNTQMQSKIRFIDDRDQLLRFSRSGSSACISELVATGLEEVEKSAPISSSTIGFKPHAPFPVRVMPLSAVLPKAGPRSD
jgi:hypothetical protein